MPILPIDSVIDIDVDAVDAGGNAAAVEDLKFTSSDPSVVSVDVVDVNTFRLVPKALGSVQITAKADVLIGDGVEEIAKFVTIEVVSGRAVDLRLSIGDPKPKPTS